MDESTRIQIRRYIDEASQPISISDIAKRESTRPNRSRGRWLTVAPLGTALVVLLMVLSLQWLPSGGSPNDLTVSSYLLLNARTHPSLVYKNTETGNSRSLELPTNHYTDYPYPAVQTSAATAVATPDGLTTVSNDLTSAPSALSSAQYFVPAEDPDQLWAVYLGSIVGIDGGQLTVEPSKVELIQTDNGSVLQPAQALPPGSGMPIVGVTGGLLVRTGIGSVARLARDSADLSLWKPNQSQPSWTIPRAGDTVIDARENVIAVAANCAPTSDDCSSVEFRSASDGTKLRSVSLDSSYAGNGLGLGAFSKDGKELAILTNDGSHATVQFLDVSSGRTVRREASAIEARSVTSFTWASDQENVLLSTDASLIQVPRDKGHQIIAIRNPSGAQFVRTR